MDRDLESQIDTNRFRAHESFDMTRRFWVKLMTYKIWLILNNNSLKFLFQSEFEKHQYLTEERRLTLSNELHLSVSQIKVWFQVSDASWWIFCHQNSDIVNNFYSGNVINLTYLRIKERKSRKYQAFEIILLLNWWHRDFIITVQTMNKIKLEIF